MFVDVVTRRDERVFLNVSHILFVTESKGCAVIFDVSGNDYHVKESFEDFCNKLKTMLQTR